MPRQEVNRTPKGSHPAPEVMGFLRKDMLAKLILTGYQQRDYLSWSVQYATHNELIFIGEPEFAHQPDPRLAAV